MLTVAILLASSIAWGGVIWLCARALQRSNVSGRARQWIWRGATLLLLAPFAAAPLVALFGWGLAPNPTVAAGSDMTGALSTAFVLQPEMLTPVADTVGLPAATAPLSFDPLQIMMLVLATGWVVRFVMAQLAARSLFGVVQFARDAGPGAARNSLRMWSRRLGMKSTPRLRIVAERVSPFSFGVLRSTICLPEGLEDRLKPEALDLVIAHECTHVARGDGWLRPLERITADVLWFNPFAWLVRRELDMARELACDEAVVSVARDRKVYARTLRDIAGFSAGLPAAVPAASMSLAGGSMLLRVSRTLGLADRKPARVAIVSACALALVGAPLAVAQVMFVMPAPEAPPAPLAPPAPDAPDAEFAFVQPPEAPPAPDWPEVPAAPEAPEAPAAAELSGDGTVRATFPATVVSTTRDATGGYSARLEGTGEASGCDALLSGFGSMIVGSGQIVAEGDAIGRRDEGRQMRLSVSCANGDTPQAFVAPPAPPAAPRAVAGVVPVAPPAPVGSSWPAAAPTPPTPVTPMTPPSAATPVTPVAPVAPFRIVNAPSAIVAAPARLTSSYGVRVHPVTKERVMHDGVDIAAPRGTAIHAPASGVVTFAGERGAYGNMVEMETGEGYKLSFSQLDSIDVKQGQSLEAGAVVGAMGSSGKYATGPHLHLEVRKDGGTVDPAAVSGLVLMSK